MTDYNEKLDPDRIGPKLSEAFGELGHEGMRYFVTRSDEEGIGGFDASCAMCASSSTMNYDPKRRDLRIWLLPEMYADLSNREEEVLAAVRRRFPVTSLELKTVPID